MKRINEDGIGGAPVNNTGSTSTTAGLSSKSKTLAGYDPLLKKRKKKFKEENLDNTTNQSRKRFKKNSVPKPDIEADANSSIEKFTESKSLKEFMNSYERVIKNNLNEDVYDKLYKISQSKFPERVIFNDKTITYIDPETALFVVKSIQSVSPELQKLFRQMMNRNIVAFMKTLSTLRRNKE